MAQARRNGVAVSLSDGYIAAIAAASGMTVATRDRMPFEAAGLASSTRGTTGPRHPETGRAAHFTSPARAPVPCKRHGKEIVFPYHGVCRTGRRHARPS